MVKVTVGVVEPIKISHKTHHHRGIGLKGDIRVHAGRFQLTQHWENGACTVRTKD